MFGIAQRRYLEEKLAKKRWELAQPKLRWFGGLLLYYTPAPVGIYRKKRWSGWGGCCQKCRKREREYRRYTEKTQEKIMLREIMSGFNLSEPFRL